jgi:DNA-binding HxlR family transcriptional regulator
MYDYNEACPISMAATVVCERWTLQIVREMFFGACKYSEIQRYIPNISPSLLRNRLRFLEQQGVVVRKRSQSGNRYEYFLTPAGKSLAPVLTEMGKWGIRWANECMTDKQNTAAGLIRDLASGLNVDELPSGDAHIQFEFEEPGNRATGFIHVRDAKVQTCDTDLGFDTDVLIRSTIRTLTKIWYGELGVDAAIESGQMTVDAAPIYRRRIGRWLGISSFVTGNPSIG